MGYYCDKCSEKIGENELVWTVEFVNNQTNALLKSHLCNHCRCAVQTFIQGVQDKLSPSVIEELEKNIHTAREALWAKNKLMEEDKK